MIVLAINPNTGNYFKDAAWEFVTLNDILYRGTYKTTPIYPRYTFQTNGRYDSVNVLPTIEFITMLPITRTSEQYLVEYRGKFYLNIENPEALKNAITWFTKDCENNIKNLNVNHLIKDTKNENTSNKI